MSDSNRRPMALLVDDDDLARELTTIALESNGFDVIAKASGGEAIQTFADLCESIDIVLLDALMPDMDGFAVCREIRSMPGGQFMPVLMLTGLDDEASIKRAYEAGATDFFIKSDKWELLAQRNRYLLRAAANQRELQRIRAKEVRAQRIAHLGHWEWDIEGRHFIASPECFHLLGMPAWDGPIPEDGFWQMLHRDDLQRVQSIVGRAILDGKMAQMECRIVGGKGVVRTVHMEAEAERDETGKTRRMHGVFQDITARKEAENQIRVLANYDSLTGLANRRFFREQLDLTLHQAGQTNSLCGVLFVDLDRFKQINDLLGHGAGDQMLVEVSERLRHSVRDRDLGGRNTDMVARLGGDEFTLLLNGLGNEADIEVVARRVVESLCKPVILNGQECQCSASVGAALLPRDGEDADSVLRHADMAMYAAKQKGGNTYMVFNADMRAASSRRLKLEHALRKAIERNELVLYYQPQIDSQSGKILGAEALMRWKHEDRLIPPGEFIPIAEETGLIIDFGEWAVNEAMAQNRQWIDQGREGLPIAVNIPGSHFEQSNFLDVVDQVLARHQMPARFLELEITETTLMRNLAATLPTLDALTAKGVRLSVDDFGTGYSSLSYLRRLPIDTLKIDASFVRELQEGSDSEAIVAAIIAMARSLHLHVIAEGVETFEQLCLLHAYGCQIMQGYYFSRPVPAAEFDQFRLTFNWTQSVSDHSKVDKAKELGLMQLGTIKAGMQ